MKVLLINGSPRVKGCTYTALAEAAAALEEENIQWEIVHIGANPIQDCVACGQCRKLGRCVFDNDSINEILQKAQAADGFIFGTPVYYAHPSGRVLSALDRLF